MAIVGKTPGYILNWLDYRAGRVDKLWIREDWREFLRKVRRKDSQKASTPLPDFGPWWRWN